MLAVPRPRDRPRATFRGAEATAMHMLRLTVHIVTLRFVVLRHGQQHSSRIGMGQRPVVVEASIVLHERLWYSTVLVDNYECFAVASFALPKPESAALWLSVQATRRSSLACFQPSRTPQTTRETTYRVTHTLVVCQFGEVVSSVEQSRVGRSSLQRLVRRRYAQGSPTE